jgi:CRP/FNR family transcriptional regulator
VNEQKIRYACTFIKTKTIFRGESFNYGENLYSKIYLLIKGKMKIAGLSDGDKDTIKDILTAPDIFGDLGMEGRPPMDEYAEALTANTEVCYFHVTDFKNLLENSPILAINYANLVNKKLKKLEDRHTDLVNKDAKSRLIRFIKNWALTDGDRIGDKIILPNYLTHSDIAGFIAITRQSVSGLFNELRDAGMLVYDRKRITLYNPLIWN